MQVKLLIEHPLKRTSQTTYVLYTELRVTYESTHKKIKKKTQN